MTNQAGREGTIRAPLSAIFRDPRVRSAFERAEGDRGPEPLATVILTPQHPKPRAGAVSVDEGEGYGP